MNVPINWRAHIIYPERVWEPCGKDANGNALWASRPVTAEDREERRKNAHKLMNPES